VVANTDARWGDLGSPPRDGAAELADLGRARVVLQVTAEPSDELERQCGVDGLEDLADDLLGVRGHPHLTAGITRFEQAQQPAAATVVEAFVCVGQESPVPVERVGLVAPGPEGLLLDPAAHLVELGVGQLHQGERVGDLHGVGEHRVQ
jgi:hypothetical protein